MIDTHCHLTYDGLHERVDEVVAGAATASVDRMVTIGTSPDDARRAAALADRFDGLFFAAGLHPHYVAAHADLRPLIETVAELARHPKMVALGEMGLDRHYPDPPLAAQRRAFDLQLQLAAEMTTPRPYSARATPLPIIIHNREATDDVLAMLRAAGTPGPRVVFHCFTGGDAELDAVLDYGAMVGFTGIVTFKNAATLAASAARVPLDRLLIETDSPYLAPEPHRRVKVNEPRYVVEVARRLAADRGMDLARFVERVDANARRFFGLPEA